MGIIDLDTCIKTTPDIWKYGAEHTYRIGVNAFINHPKLTNIAYSNVTFVLKCRPFSSVDSIDRTNSLQCYVNDSQIRNSELDVTTKLTNMTETLPFEIGNQKFELIYDKKGIKEIRIEPLIVGWRLNMLRSLASHLNFGFDRFDKGGERFAVVELVGQENSTIGECETKFEVSKQLTGQGKRWTSKCGEKIHLETYAYGSKNPMIAMDKTRDPNKCIKSTPYIFGADAITKEKPAFFKMQVVSII